MRSFNENGFDDHRDGDREMSWKAFELDNKQDLERVLKVAEQLQELGRTINDYYGAFVQSGTRDVAANLHFMEYLRMKRSGNSTLPAAPEAEAAAPMVRPMISATAQDGVAVVLVSFGNRKIDVAKKIKYLTHLSLMESKLLIERAPTTIGRCKTVSGAKAAADAIIALGGQSRVE